AANSLFLCIFFFQAEDGIRDFHVTGVQTCALPIFDFERKSLCTVELAKDLIPNQPSYSLGKLVRSLGIPVADRHRAAGDAMATRSEERRVGKGCRSRWVP